MLYLLISNSVVAINYKSFFLMLKYKIRISDGEFGSDYAANGCSHTVGAASPEEWWLVDLQDTYTIDRVSLTNRDGKYTNHA